jgi:FtsP/CotA-like multicopper oxidase with cupredoxin domain
MTEDSSNAPGPERSPLSRREILTGGVAGVAATAVLSGLPRVAAAQDVPGAARPRAGSPAATGQRHAAQNWLPPAQPGRDYQPVVIPNGAKLTWKVVDGVKVFHMVAEEVSHEIAPGLKIKGWGYNGFVHGPALEVVEGDRVRIYVTNRLPAGTSVHWHGLLLPNGMDGVAGLNQKVIRPGETFKYEFTIRQAGTAMYHSHHDEMTQMALGMTGLFIIHPRRPKGPKIDRDFALLLHEWSIPPGTERPDPMEMTDFNVLTMNARAFPGTDPLVVRKGQRVRIRLGNLSAMSHHPIHLHGYQFLVTETDGGRIAESAQWPETTVIVPVGSTRTIEFVADEPGDWALHCHMTHHVMNQMGHGIPNMVGVDTQGLDQKARKLLPAYMSMGQTGMDMSEHQMPAPKNSIPMVGGQGKHDYITMGGMFTILKVRDQLTSYKDPGWYENPAGTLASASVAADLQRDGVDPKTPPKGDASDDVRWG